MKSRHPLRAVRAVAVLAVLAAVTLLATGEFERPALAAGSWYVDPAGDDLNTCKAPGAATACLTIQGAIGKAASGDTINVAAGIYYENVTVGKPLTLQGEDRETTVIDGSGTGNVVHITADNVQFGGFTVRNGNDGILVDGANTNTISESKVISNAQDGIAFRHGASYNTLAESDAANNGRAGIQLYGFEGTRNNTIINCNVYDNGDRGIVGYVTTDGTQVIGCNVYDNALQGILIGWSSWTVRDSNVYSNGQDGIWLDTASYTVIEDSNIHSNGGDGVQLLGIPAHHNTIRRNNICWNEDYGVWARGPDYAAHDNRVYHNNFIDNVRVPQGWDGGTNNAWDDGYPSGGNYWSDYTGEDIDLDGIADTPYDIAGPAGAQDRYPLMDPSLPADCGTTPTPTATPTPTPTPTPTATPTPTPTGTPTSTATPPPPVGGISVGPELGALPLETADSSGNYTGVLAGVSAAITAGAVALGGVAWFARRRLR